MDGDLVTGAATVRSVTDPSTPARAYRASKRPNRLVIVLIALSVGGIIVAGALIAPKVLPVLADDPGKFDITGELAITGSGLKYGSHSGACQGDAGYADIHGGTSVVISDVKGVTVAMGQLSAEGKPERHPVSPIKPISCTFTFAVADVPEGSAFYGVTISKRGTQQFAREKLKGPISLTLT